MADYVEVRKEIRKRIQQPENRFRGITEETGLRILDGIYIIAELLQQKISAEAAQEIKNPDKSPDFAERFEKWFT